MKSTVCLIIALMLCLSFGHLPLFAQEPRINLSAANQPLSEVLDQITSDTGYQFNLSPKWENHRVSASLTAIPLEQGLKRLLRSLNYSIVWESDRVVTILVYGKAEPGRDGGAVSFAPPPQEIPEEPEPEEPEPADELESEAEALEEAAAPEETASGDDVEGLAADVGERDADTSADSDAPRE